MLLDMFTEEVEESMKRFTTHLATCSADGLL